jgi:hypothetical protein
MRENKMKVKRLKEMSQLERAIIMMVWNDIQKQPNYANWRSYERGFKHDGKAYRYKCKFKVEDGHLRLADTSIEYEQVVIDLMH